MPGSSEKLAQAAGLYRAGRSDEAGALFREVLAQEPDSADALFFLGCIATDAGRPAEAEPLLRRALAQRPGEAAFHAALGNALARGGRHEAARASFHQALALQPGLVELHGSLAHTALALGRHAEALPHFEQLLRVDPRPELRHRYAAALLELKRHAPAEAALRQVLAELPQDAAARSDLGLALLGLNRVQEAMAEFGEALRLDPRRWQARHNLGLAKFRLGEFDAARADLESARALGADDPGLLANLGYLHCFARDFGRGEALLRDAVARHPAHRRARHYLGLCLLGRGRFAEGWEHWRGANASMELPRPRWDGEPLAGRRLLVWSEEGIGDQIMFCNPLPELAAAGARVVLECNPRLQPLFARSFPGAEVVAHSGAQRARLLESVDLHAPMSLLPRHLRPSRASFPRHGGYLRAAPERVAYWRERLDALGPGPKVGLSWAGGGVSTGRLRRSTALADWLPLLRVPGLRCVSLQYTDCGPEIEQLRAGHGIALEHWQEAIDDYDETAALVSALDAVACVCTAVLHLAGALGRPTWAAVPWWPSWRYLLEGEEMPWYPSVRLLRQEAHGDWSGPVARIAALAASL